MLQNDSVLCTIILTIDILSFLLGYTIAKIGQNHGVYSNVPKQKIDQKSVQNKKISIDDTKYVVNIDTNDLEKKYSSLGETKESDQKIESAVQKLKNMKG